MVLCYLHLIFTYSFYWDLELLWLGGISKKGAENNKTEEGT